MAADMTVTVVGVKKIEPMSFVRIALYGDAKSFRHEASALQVLLGSGNARRGHGGFP